MPGHVRGAFIAGLLIFIITILGALLIGNIYSDTRARILIEAMAPSLNTLCFAIITASATIVSLMLATLGFAYRVDNDFEPQFYYQVKLIAQASSAALMLSVILLLLLTIPLTESDALRSWFTTAYYILILGSATISALIVSIIILLYSTMVDIISVVSAN